MWSGLRCCAFLCGLCPSCIVNAQLLALSHRVMTGLLFLLFAPRQSFLKVNFSFVIFLLSLCISGSLTVFGAFPPLSPSLSSPALWLQKKNPVCRCITLTLGGLWCGDKSRNLSSLDCSLLSPTEKAVFGVTLWRRGWLRLEKSNRVGEADGKNWVYNRMKFSLVLQPEQDWGWPGDMPWKSCLGRWEGLAFGSLRVEREWYRTRACKVIFTSICHNILKQHPELGLFRTHSLGQFGSW